MCIMGSFAPPPPLGGLLELVDANAYKLQPSLSDGVIVDGHGCHTALQFGVKAKEN